MLQLQWESKFGTCLVLMDTHFNGERPWLEFVDAVDNVYKCEKLMGKIGFFVCVEQAFLAVILIHHKWNLPQYSHG